MSEAYRSDAYPSVAYPTVVVNGTLVEPLSRWLWIFKWLLAIPHYIVLVFLWLGMFISVWIVLIASIFTRTYPRALYDYNLGVLRWTWRVEYYSYSVLGTDKYPPFSFGEYPRYPATLYVGPAPEISFGKAIRNWVYVIPHLFIVSVLTSGIAWTFGDSHRGQYATSFISVLTVIVALALLFLGRYPKGLFDLLMGLHRWIYRALAYGAFMTMDYPPYRLDQGGLDPAAGIDSVGH